MAGFGIVKNAAFAAAGLGLILSVSCAADRPTQAFDRHPANPAISSATPSGESGGDATAGKLWTPEAVGGGSMAAGDSRAGGAGHQGHGGTSLEAGVDPVNPGGVRLGADAGPAPVPPGAAATRPATAAPIIYTCPMHPQIRQPDPGNCPICGMTLIPEKPAAVEAWPAAEHHHQ